MTGTLSPEADDAMRVVIVQATELLLLQHDAARGDADAQYVARAAIEVIQVVIVPALIVLKLEARKGPIWPANAGFDVLINEGRIYNNAPAYCPIRCTCCLHKTIISGDSYRIGIVLPGVPGPTIGLAFIVCDRCGRGYGRIDLAVARTVRRWLLAPDRTSGGGRGRT